MREGKGREGREEKKREGKRSEEKRREGKGRERLCAGENIVQNKFSLIPKDETNETHKPR